MKSKEQASGKWQLDLFGLLCDAKAFTERERERDRERWRRRSVRRRRRRRRLDVQVQCECSTKGKLPKRQKDTATSATNTYILFEYILHTYSSMRCIISEVHSMYLHKLEEF